MLTRLYIDNFRCFESFEFIPRQKQLILGGNGSGKSTLADALLWLRQIAIAGVPLDGYNLKAQRARWSRREQQSFEVEALINGDRYVYRLVLGPGDEPSRTKVGAESVQMNGRTLFAFDEGEVSLFDDDFRLTTKYPFDWHRSAFATVVPRTAADKLKRFQEWFAAVYCFRINPFAMASRSEGEHAFPNLQLDNFASWYRHLVQAQPLQAAELAQSLKEVIEGFKVLSLQGFGENVKLLFAHFEQPAGAGEALYLLNELSEGQRCLIGLYAILHFILGSGGTIILDEPDNFVGLREIQPWLMAAMDMAEEHGGQILIISHHPEIIDQLAPSNSTLFYRERGGPVRSRDFPGDRETGVLTTSELIARGWID